MALGNVNTEYVELSVSDGTKMRAYVARPKTPGKLPGMIVYQEAFGVNSHIRNVTERFAEKGMLAVAPELFHRSAGAGFEAGYDNFAAVMPHLQSVMNPQNLSVDVQATYQWLSSESSVDKNAIGSVGFCMGGTVSFLTNALVPLKAAISFYGGGIAPSERFPSGLLNQTGSLHAPMLLFWGGKDQHITPAQTRAVADSLKNANKQFVDVTFSDADHGFFCDARPSYNRGAALQAWALTNAFLELNLGTQRAASA
jgi:carboxymethylenebutenolidase